MSLSWKIVIAVIVMASVIWLLLPVIIESMINSIAFHPIGGEHVTGDQLGVPIEEVYFPTSDGLSIHGFYLPRPESNRAIIYFHGNAAAAWQLLYIARQMSELDANVLIVDYRGYGFSEGKPDEKGIYIDAKAAIDYITSQREIPEHRIVLFGRSLGGAVAIDAAQGMNFAGVVVMSTIRSGRQMAKDIGLGFLAPLVKGRFASKSKIRKVNVPLLSFHGDADDIVPVQQGIAIYEAAIGPKEMFIIKGAGHNDIFEVAGDQFWQPFKEFLNSVAPLNNE